MKVKGIFKDIYGPIKVSKLRQNEIKKADDRSFDDKILILNNNKEIKEASLYKILYKEENEAILSIKIDKEISINQNASLRIKIKYKNQIQERLYPILNYFNNLIDIYVDYSHDLVSKAFMKQSKEKIDAKIILHDNLYKELRDSKNLALISAKQHISRFIFLELSNYFRNLGLNIKIFTNDLDSILIKYLKKFRTNAKIYNFIDLKDLLKSNIDYTYMLCGSLEDFNYFKDIIKDYNILRRRIIFFKEKTPINLLTLDEYPKDLYNSEFIIKVIQGNIVKETKAKASNTLKETLEENMIKTYSGCLFGLCSICRIKVIEGMFFIPKSLDRRRESDIKLNYTNSCVTYPLSDMIIKINI
jgi:ferredoxin